MTSKSSSSETVSMIRFVPPSSVYRRTTPASGFSIFRKGRVTAKFTAMACFVRRADGSFAIRPTTTCGCQGICPTCRPHWKMRILSAPCTSMSNSKVGFTRIFSTSSGPNSGTGGRAGRLTLTVRGKQWFWPGIRRAPAGGVFALARGLDHYADRVGDRSVHVDEVCARTLVQNSRPAMAYLAALPRTRSTQLDRSATRGRTGAMDGNHRAARRQGTRVPGDAAHVRRHPAGAKLGDGATARSALRGAGTRGDAACKSGNRTRHRANASRKGSGRTGRGANVARKSRGRTEGRANFTCKRRSRAERGAYAACTRTSRAECGAGAACARTSRTGCDSPIDFLALDRTLARHDQPLQEAVEGEPAAGMREGSRQ